MKIFSMKTIKYPVLAALTVLLCVSLTSCGYSKSDAREMIEKANGNKLEEGDYSDMVDWLEDYNDSYLDEWAEVIADNGKYNDYVFAKSDLDRRFDEKYPYIGSFRNIVMDADEKVAGKETMEKFQELQNKVGERADSLSEKVPARPSGYRYVAH